MAGHQLFNSGSNESSLAPQFKWLDNTFKRACNFIFVPSVYQNKIYMSPVQLTHKKP